MEMECLPRFGYGLEARDLERRRARRGGRPRRGRHRAAADQRHGADDRRTAPSAARLRLRENESGFCAVTWGNDDLGGPRSAPEALERLDSTEEFWRDWLRDGNFPDHPWRIHLQRSALVLKGLTYTPTGAIVAAPTTSLPETPGGERNWDYRFSWIRDSTFSLWAMHTLGFDQEARDFMRFIVDVCKDHPDLQIMYGIGAREGADREDPRPPRRLRRREAGADRQRRLRPAPERRLGRPARLDLPARKSAQRARHAGRPRADPLPGGSGDRRLAEPDQGIWESRGEPQHYVSSKLMIWVAVDRGARLARGIGFDELADEWRAQGGRDQGGDPRARRPRRRLPPALRHRRARRLAAADPAAALPAARRPARASPPSTRSPPT